MDDQLIAERNEKDIFCVKQLLKQWFKVKDISEVRMVLRIRFRTLEQYMILDQSKYLAVILRQFLNKTSS